MYNRGRIISEYERLELLEWSKKLIKNQSIQKIPVLPGGGSGLYHYLLSPNDTASIPLVWTIKQRLIEKEGLQGYNETHPNIRDLLLIVEKGYSLPKHTDGNKNIYIRTRFNIFIQIPDKGSETYYDSSLVDTIEGSYVLCRSGIDEHYSNMNNDDKPRVSLSFGFLLPPEKLDELTSDPKVGTYRFYPLTLPK